MLPPLGASERSTWEGEGIQTPGDMMSPGVLSGEDIGAALRRLAGAIGFRRGFKKGSSSKRYIQHQGAGAFDEDTTGRVPASRTIAEKGIPDITCE